MTQIRPESGEYAPFYQNYIALVPAGDLFSILDAQPREWKSLLGGLSEAQAEFRYDPGKWSIKEVVGHVADTERIFTYRVLRIARGDQTPLPGFEQDDYVKEGNFSTRKLADLLDEFSAVRNSTLALLRSLNQQAWTRRGNANQKEVTVRALGFIIAGHERHHRLILEQRYLPTLPRA
jgi:uncharacterized damage-inducible protein DinB